MSEETDLYCRQYLDMSHLLEKVLGDKMGMVLFSISSNIMRDSAHKHPPWLIGQGSKPSPTSTPTGISDVASSCTWSDLLGPGSWAINWSGVYSGIAAGSSGSRSAHTSLSNEHSLCKKKSIFTAKVCSKQGEVKSWTRAVQTHSWRNTILHSLAPTCLNKSARKFLVCLVRP